MVPRNICCGSKDDIIARRYFSPALARSTPFNRAISCELKSLWTVASFGLQLRLAKDKVGITGGSGTGPDDGPDPPVILMERE
jgi:hypothetical protein